MKLNTNELKLFREVLLARRSLADTDLPGKSLLWQPWMEGTLSKVTDELYPVEFDVI